MPQILFVDHIGKNITPFDPRLAFICLNYKKSGKQEKPNSCRSAPPLRRLKYVQKLRSILGPGVVGR